MTSSIHRLSRRRFVGGSFAAAGATFAMPAYAMLAAMPYRVLFDRDSSAGRAYGSIAAARGAALLSVGEDLGLAWMYTIEPRLREGPVPLAGLTHGAALFCLEFLARDHGLKTAYRVEARAPLDSAWLRHAAASACSIPQERNATNLGLLDLSDEKGRALYSWMLIPR